MRAPALDRAELERQKAFARIEIASCKVRCRDNYDLSGWHPGAIQFGCYNFHHHVQNLRRAEERLRELEHLGLTLPPDTEAP